MTLHLDAETGRLIQRELESGLFPDAAAVVAAAIRHMLAARDDLGHTPAQIDAMLTRAVEIAGRVRQIDSEEFFAELDRE